MSPWITWSFYNLKLESQGKRSTSDAYFDVHEAAARLKVRPGLVRKLVKCNRLKAHKVGKLLRFSQDDLDEFIAAQKVAAVEKKRKLPTRKPRLLPVVKKEAESDILTKEELDSLWQ